VTAPARRRPSAPPPPADRARGPVELIAAVPLGPALCRLRAEGQAVGLVLDGREVVGVVTDDDLSFALDWSGPEGHVADAVTLHVVEHAAPRPPSIAPRPRRG